MPTRPYRFVQVDVFTDRVFGGNPLAVFVDGRGLDDALMQQIAREMNLSETVFLFPPSRPAYAAALRIFTPARELPLRATPPSARRGCWPPTARHKGAPRASSSRKRSGPFPWSWRRSVAPDFIWMTQQEAIFDPALDDRAGMAKALGPARPIFSPGRRSSWLHREQVPLRAPSRRAPWTGPCSTCAECSRSWAIAAHRNFVFAPDPDPGRGESTRACSPPHLGRPGGSGHGVGRGPLGAYLVRHGLVKKTGEVKIVSEQGTRMGRQSFIHIKLGMQGDRITSIRVGGNTVPVLNGELELSGS
jgi:trans-2,3-dihydro-3-hydroxyanthranilate isomerase